MAVISGGGGGDEGVIVPLTIGNSVKTASSNNNNYFVFLFLNLKNVIMTSVFYTLLQLFYTEIQIVQ